jgi:hypothetical protein
MSESDINFYCFNKRSSDTQKRQQRERKHNELALFAHFYRLIKFPSFRNWVKY